MFPEEFNVPGYRRKLPKSRRPLKMNDNKNSGMPARPVLQGQAVADGNGWSSGEELPGILRPPRGAPL